MGGRGENDPILSDQQSLHISTGQAGGANYAHHITTNYSFPRIFRLSYGRLGLPKRYVKIRSTQTRQIVFQNCSF